MSREKLGHWVLEQDNHTRLWIEPALRKVEGKITRVGLKRIDHKQF
jgi:hypothetical protein